jgi:hypothetical protein
LAPPTRPANVALVKLTIYRRRPARGGVEILGDAQLLDFWLERVTFG